MNRGLENFAKFEGKHLQCNPFFSNFPKKESLTGVFRENS